MNLTYLSLLANHLWQSTLFAAVAGLLTLALRNNHARVRYWVWLAASLKFLIPLSMLVSMGSLIRWQTAPKIELPGLSAVMDEVSQPFTAPVVSSPSLPPAASHLPAILLSIWVCGFLGITTSWWIRWRRILATVRRGSPVQLAIPIPARSSPALVEPGIFGVFRPVLLLPESIFERLTPAQLRAVLDHELCHIRYRDNLIAAIHMFVETFFWFHPLVWWIGTRLVEERERACDEEVLRLGGEPQVYAEGILNICKLYVESPLECLPGVTGANLKKRIEAIMKNRTRHELSPGRKLLLSATALLVVAGPLAIGMMNSPSFLMAQPSPAFEVASVKAHPPGDPQRLEFLPSGRLSIEGAPLQVVVAIAYGLPFQTTRLSGGPNWIRDAGSSFDIEAKADDGALTGLSRNAREAKMRLMLQALLADRFKLIIRRDQKEQPVYILIVGKKGSKLQPAKVDEKYCSDHPAEAANQCHQIGASPTRGIHSTAIDMSDLVWLIGSLADRAVLDRTGLQGLYDIHTDGFQPLRQTPPRPPGTDKGADAAPSDPDRPTLFMIFETLGLKLESSRATVDTFVIDHVERPSEN